jgi:hypothetical protein
MPIDLSGIHNVGEFYSYHYLDALLEGDLKGLFARWRRDYKDGNRGAAADDASVATPDRRLERCAADFFRAKRDALRERQPKRRYPPSHSMHVALLEALGYPYDFCTRYLADGSAVPVLSAVGRDGRPYLWLVETTFTDPEDAPLDQFPLRAQYPPSADGEHYAVPAEPWETLVGEIFRCAEPPRWLIFLAGRYIYLLDRTKWGQGQYLLFDLDEILGRRQRDTLRAAAALLARDALCPDEGLPLHDTLNENSHKHAYGVSADLKYGVRRAVELLANEYVWYQRHVRKQALFQDDDLARKLTVEALTYLYRLLFLFYAEARGGELDLVPMKNEAYRTGYSLESLRDLEQVPLNTPQAQDGYFIHTSLEQLFQLVNEGFPPDMQLDLRESDQPLYDNYGFSVSGLRSPLFDPASTPLLSSARFRNLVLQEVLQLLSLSREKRGRKSVRGRISYAQLGINQLGAVYEGLLSYSGFFAQEPLVEVKPAQARAGDELTQTYFVPESQVERYAKDEFVYQDGVRKGYPRGSFIFRLAGRDREKSASYYTPEVLTRCVVKYSLKELLQDKSADEILGLTICEPAMGSGAFINEALNQLADAYLERKQIELERGDGEGGRISPEEYRVERQRVKAYLAAHNAYGVDLNPMAVELAQVSIWLNTIYPGMAAPWYGARMAVGNSLVGARRQVYSASDVRGGKYATQAPTPAPLRLCASALKSPPPRPQGSVYHWLLPDKGMAAFDRDRVIRELAPEQVAAIKAWRKNFTAKITPAELKNLQALSDLADDLWTRHLRERQALLDQTRAPIPLWGQPDPLPTPHSPLPNIKSNQKALEHLHRPTGPLRRLKLALDYWCALWFWPIPEAHKLPTRQQFLDDLAGILRGAESEYQRPPQQRSLFDEPAAPQQERLSDLAPVSVEALCQENERLAIVQETAEQVSFHHWELVFAEVFAERGGFDVVTGNPPWVMVIFDEKGLLSDYDPRIALRKLSATQVSNLRSEMMPETQILQSYLNEFAQQTGAKSFLSSPDNFPLLIGMKANLYKCFVTRSWELGTSKGIVGFLHPEGVYDDPKGGELRGQLYSRLKLHFQFQNELKLFPEIGNTRKYSVNVQSAVPQNEVGFDNIFYLLHPSTIDTIFLRKQKAFLFPRANRGGF